MGKRGRGEERLTARKKGIVNGERERDRDIQGGTRENENGERDGIGVRWRKEEK